MNKLGPPADNALLAAKLAPRLELVALPQGQVSTDAATGPVAGVQKIVNDVRLPSHLALEQRLPGVLSGAAPSADASAPAAARLSPAARLISALLAQLPDAGPLRGAVPLWPAARQPASAAAMAGALAQAVDRSGLFYESHLAQFATGARTLAQMAQEPQSRWASPSLARGDAAASSAPAAGAAGAAGAAAVASDAAGTSAAPVAQGPGVTPEAARAGAVPAGPLPAAGDTAPAPPGALPAAPRPAQPGAGAAIPLPPVPAEAGGAAPARDAERVRAVYRAGEFASASSSGADRMRREIEGAPQAAAVLPPSAPAMPTPAVEMIHPQAATLVHQQLDLLATAAFRWSGQAWPEVPMHWTIHEDEARPQEGDDGSTPQPRRWSTTISLDLPRLGAVELRLTLAASAVQAHLVASRAATADQLRARGGVLQHRLDAAGLGLEGLVVSERDIP